MDKVLHLSEVFCRAEILTVPTSQKWRRTDNIPSKQPPFLEHPKSEQKLGQEVGAHPGRRGFRM